MALTNTAVSNAKAKDKSYKLSDNGGLYLQVNPSGYRCWKYDYRLYGKRGTYTIGPYPDISLKQAREQHKEAREKVALGEPPITIKQAKKIEFERDTTRFSDYAKQWLAKQKLADSTFKDLKQRIDKNLTPYMDRKPIHKHTTLDLLNITKKISDRGAEATAQKMANVLRKIYNDVLILGLVENNPAQGLAELLPKPDSKAKSNFGHITSKDELKVLLRQIKSPSPRQDFAVTQALRLMPLVFLRPKNIRFLKWEYIDFDKNFIHLPGSELKTGKPLDVPLSKQAKAIIEAMLPATGKRQYVFITNRGKRDEPLSENTTTQALKRIINPETGKPFGTGYMTSHGFRHTASTFLNELGFDPDVIELQLAHVNKDRIRATYNKAQWMPKRIEMMQAWADYLDNLLGL